MRVTSPLPVRGRRRNAARRRGAAMVEFALILPLLVFFLFGFFEFGRVMMVQNSLTLAAREGVRKALLRGTSSPAQVEQVIRARLNRLQMNGDAALISVSPEDLTALDPGDQLFVGVWMHVSDITWVPMPENVYLRARLTAARE